MTEWFKTSSNNGKVQIFDPIRQRYVALTPEEQVRQYTLKILVEHILVPQGLIAVEYSIKVNKLDKRCDIVVFDRAGNPLVIVECKAAEVKICDKTLDQAARYYSALKPKYLILTNGANIFCFKATESGLVLLEKIPPYDEMTDNN